MLFILAFFYTSLPSIISSLLSYTPRNGETVGRRRCLVAENDTNARIVLPPKWAQAMKGHTTQSGGRADTKARCSDEQSMAGVASCGRSFKSSVNFETKAVAPCHCRITSLMQGAFKKVLLDKMPEKIRVNTRHIPELS